MALSKKIQSIIDMVYNTDFEIDELVNKLEDCKEQAEELEEDIKDLRRENP